MAFRLSGMKPHTSARVNEKIKYFKSCEIFLIFTKALSWWVLFFLHSIMAHPVTNMVKVESIKGAPRMAPIPISDEWAVSFVKSAMIGMRVSGKAVPMAASTEPTAPSDRLSSFPSHSMAFTNSSAATSIIMRLNINIANSILSPRQLYL